MDLGLTGKVCAVTGASRGLGLAVAKGLCAEGASVLLIGRDESALAGAERECRSAAPKEGGTGAALTLDVTAEDAGQRLVNASEEHFGQLDVLVNNAGWARWAAIETISDEDWRAQYEINVMAPMRAMKAALPPMAERGWGRVVNVCSSAGKRPSTWTPDYSVNKAAELSLSRWFADRYAASGALVNAICPGPIRTPMWTGPGGLAEQSRELNDLESAEAALQAAGAGRPIGRIAEVDEIADAILFLCSERASYVAGAAWSVDGGSVPVII